MHFRVTPKEKERIRERAENAGLSVSDYLRRQALSKEVTVVSPELFKEYHEMCSNFGRLGNNLNQVARHLNSGGSQDMVLSLHLHITQWFQLPKNVTAGVIPLLKVAGFVLHIQAR